MFQEYVKHRISMKITAIYTGYIYPNFGGCKTIETRPTSFKNIRDLLF